MEPAKRFLEYAAAFEETYADDDWTRLEPYFVEDAAYTSTGEPPLGGRWKGRTQVLEHLRESVEALDRRFDARSVEPIGAPRVGDDFFEVEWRATYTKAGCPDLVFGGTERVTFEGERIRLMEDTNEDGADRRIQEYLARHFD